MNSRILSLNIGTPSEMSWDGKSVISSMHRKPISGPLVVHFDRIEGNEFKNDTVHGIITSVIYLMGRDALDEYAKLISKPVGAGDVGENVTLETLDETKVMIGDEFQIGEVVFQAIFPRIPCVKVNYRFQHPNAQQLLKDLGRSGVYGKIIKPGKILKSDTFKLIKKSASKVSIADVYKTWRVKDFPNASLYQDLKDNSAFPKEALGLIRPK